MEVLINELSLTGQFENENNFFDSLDCVLRIITIIKEVNFTLSKEVMFFNSSITSSLIFGNILQLRSDRAKKVKSFLDKLMRNPPSWNDNKIHNCKDDKYLYNSSNVCETSLAESCERDKIIISFNHKDFLNTNLTVQKNNNTIDIFNIIDRSSFLEYLFKLNKIEVLSYCKLKFKKSNLDFSNIDNQNGFSILNTQQIKEFINSFIQFSKMSWVDIEKSDGLQYKPTTTLNYNNKNIYKFRITQKYRCFGYRENNEFFILRFEIDHKISDKG